MNEEEAKAADKKSSRNTFIFVIVAIILAVAAIGYTVVKLKYDADQQKEWEADYLRALAYTADASYRADVAHDNYTNNPVAMSLFNNITTTYPFLVAQTKILFTDMDVLTNNVTIPNYYTAWKQYLLCNIINKAYEQNISKYSVIIKNFIWMDYNYYGDVAYVVDSNTWYIQVNVTNYPTQQHFIDEGYLVYRYTSALEKANSKLDFINGVLDVIYTG